MNHLFEKRKLKRFPIILESRVSYIGEENLPVSQKLHTTNISAAGAYINTYDSFRPGSELIIEFVLPLDRLTKKGKHRSVIKTAGKVIRQEHSGIAVKFKKNCKILPLMDNLIF